MTPRSATLRIPLLAALSVTIYFFVLMRRRRLVKTAAGPIGAEPRLGVPSAERAMPS